ncbi:hypothetical protein ACIBQ1_05810 [Nonomuraea sp. NPDC050153]|uniref:hypothetical protein n=1 Tax=Nonomuraea sp. NPDC050153 TaxID=3364359 RepID=UPI00378A2130
MTSPSADSSSLSARVAALASTPNAVCPTAATTTPVRFRYGRSRRATTASSATLNTAW